LSITKVCKLKVSSTSLAKEWLLNQFDWPEQNSKCEPAYECLYAHTIKEQFLRKKIIQKSL